MAPSISRLVKLSEVISRNSKLLNAHLVNTKLPQPSFAYDAPSEGIVIDRHDSRRKELEKARKELISATKELHDLSVGAKEGLRSNAWNVSLNFFSPLFFGQHSIAFCR